MSEGPSRAPDAGPESTEHAESPGIAWWQAVLPVVVVALLAGVVIGIVVQGGGGPAGAAGSPSATGSVSVSASPGSSAGASTSKSPGLTKIDPARISVTATSVLPPDPDSYAPEQTLDGDTTTAWNSDGSNIGAAGRPTLTYTFDEPVRIGRITVSNGYQKNDRLFQSNRRVRTLVVTVGTVTHTFSLADKKTAQKLDFDFGTAATTVTVRIGEVYPGTKYYDIALSEVAFYAVP